LGVKHRTALESSEECVWVEITVTDSCNLLIGNHCLTPDVKVDTANNYFNFLENILYSLNYHVLSLGNFNVPGFDCNYGLSSPNCHYYTKLKGDAIHCHLFHCFKST
jgi:hypothetical protein